MTALLWPIVREMIKTAIENKQNLIVEGCYVPLYWAEDFSSEYLSEIRFICLIMSEKYIRNHFDDIKGYANIIENRLDDSDCTIEGVIKDNADVQKLAEKYRVNYALIDENYDFDIDFGV